MDYYTGQIILWGGIKVPVGWSACNGQMLAINTYQALYSIIGTTYGGDGRTTFGLPNLQSRVPVGQGQGTGLTNRVIGSFGGEEAVFLTDVTVPVHTHTMIASSAPVTLASPTGAIPGTLPTTCRFYFTPATDTTPAAMAADSVSSVGSSQAHLNVMPSIGIQYIICLNSLYPVKP